MKKRNQPSHDINFDFLSQAYQSLMAWSYSSLFVGLLLAISAAA